MAIAAILSGIAPGACSTSSTEAELKEEPKEALVQACPSSGARRRCFGCCAGRGPGRASTRAKRDLNQPNSGLKTEPGK